MISPTIGRIVWYRDGSSQPLAAIVTYVWSDRLVNLAVFNPNDCLPFGKTSVTLMQDGDQLPVGESYAEWMPYQKGQAAKHDAEKAATPA
jgi:hypothetical protein